MKRFLIASVSLIIFAVISLGYFYLTLSQPVSTDTATKNFIINQGDGLFSIADRLEKNQYIRNRFVFIAYAYQTGLNGKLQAGLFRLSPSLSTQEIASKLATGGSQDYWLKIIGGTRLEEVVKNYPLLAGSKEGYLFPDSYLIPQDYDHSQVLEIITNNFDKKITSARENFTAGISTSQAVILASLLEREARTLTSKQMVSGILQNRLKIGMALQVDAAVQYARDSKNKPSTYWQPLTKTDLSINSPFNTYKNPGLPPSPICNPGYDSLYAAFHPTPSDYLFYITGNDNQMHYAKTLEEHNANIAKYLK